ncbi:MAG: glycosyltransferase family 4 protein [Pelolinea sp.]|nr:glycosyltransferase family 4 protein [Pelolinea sp.]
MTNKRLLVLPRYTSKGPSSRVRFYQYLPYLEEAGFIFDVHPFFGDAYIDALFNRDPQNILGIISSYFHRVFTILKSSRYDLVWMQYELLPFIPYWLENIFLKRITKLVVDYDDAVFHNYDQHRICGVRIILGGKISKIMRSAQVVVAGNHYIADYATQSGAKRVVILHSAVDTKRYQVSKTHSGSVIKIGWIGSPVTVKYLESLRPIFERCLSEKMKLVIVGGGLPDALRGLPIENISWSEESEVQSIQSFDIGIMPLADSPFERGKCGYKLIQYMACGIPVIASPVGINTEIVDHGKNGFLASNENEWLEALTKLKADATLRQYMGRNGRKLVEEKYSLQVCSTKLISAEFN